MVVVFDESNTMFVGVSDDGVVGDSEKQLLITPQNLSQLIQELGLCVNDFGLPSDIGLEPFLRAKPFVIESFLLFQFPVVDESLHDGNQQTGQKSGKQ